MIHFGNHLHTGDSCAVLLSGHVREFCNQASYDKRRKGFRKQSFAIASKIGHKPTVHEFGGEERDDSHAECDSKDTRPRR